PSISVSESARTSTTATSAPTAATPPGSRNPPTLATTRRPAMTDTLRPNSFPTNTRPSAAAASCEWAPTETDRVRPATPYKSLNDSRTTPGTLLAPYPLAMDQHVRGRVLVVDDEPTIREVVSRYLARAGYDTTVAATGREAIRTAVRDRPDVIVLDLMLPDVDGLEVMRRLRQQDRDRTAIVLLTARGEESDRVIGLRLGADDYVVKPFSPAELVARVDAMLRRLEPTLEHQPTLPFDGLKIDPDARQVRLDGQLVELTQREFELLLFLARH